jgi:hypothetical protein
MDILSPRLSDDLGTRKINSCSMVWPNRKDIHPDFGLKKLKLKLKLKRGDVQVITRGGLTALIWKDMRSVHADQHKPTTQRRKFL